MLQPTDPPNEALPSGFRVVAHLPERRRSTAGVPMQAGACCCSCCCCLHAVGGVIGGLVGSLSPVSPARPRDPSPFPFRMDEPEPPYTWFATLTFWTAFALLTILMVGAQVHGRLPRGANLGAAAFLTFLYLPAVQLGACLLSLVAVAIAPEHLVLDRGASVRRIGAITWSSLVGCFIGLALLMVTCGGFPFWGL
jgi:hypothetical protein